MKTTKRSLDAQSECKWGAMIKIEGVRTGHGRSLGIRQWGQQH